jgi:hypothetical protein
VYRNVIYKSKSTSFNQKIIFLTLGKFRTFPTLNFASSKNNKIIYNCTAEKHLKQTNTFFNIRSFDDKFNLLTKIKLDKKPKFFHANGENLFLLYKNEKCSTISMYNHNLEVVQTFGQENSKLPFFCPPEIDFFLVSNQYFIIRETVIDEDDDDGYHESVTIMNRSNGLVEGSFVIYEGFHQMKLYLDKFLITFNRETCFLKCYNFQGDLLHKITLDEKFKRSYFGILNKELYFVLDDDILSIF